VAADRGLLIAKEIEDFKSRITEAKALFRVRLISCDWQPIYQRHSAGCHGDQSLSGNRCRDTGDQDGSRDTTAAASEFMQP
jgi:hypothetical protein